MKAYCYASGLIEFGSKVPEGALAICSGPAAKVRRSVSGFARRGYDKTLLVPGVPEADTEEAALDALIKWQAQVLKDLK